MMANVFSKDGTITAGNSSGITDGAAAVLVMSEEALKESGAEPLARIVDYEIVGVPPEIVAKMNRILDAFLKTDEAKKQFAMLGARTLGGDAGCADGCAGPGGTAWRVLHERAEPEGPGARSTGCAGEHYRSQGTGNVRDGEAAAGEGSRGVELLPCYCALTVTYSSVVPHLTWSSVVFPLVFSKEMDMFS